MTYSLRKMLRGSPFRSVSEARKYQEWYYQHWKRSIWEGVKRVMAEAIIAAHERKPKTPVPTAEIRRGR